MLTGATVCWALRHLRKLDRALAQQVDSCKAGRVISKASFNPEKRTPCPLVHISICPGGSQGHTVPQLGSVQAFRVVVGVMVAMVVWGF